MQGHQASAFDYEYHDCRRFELYYFALIEGHRNKTKMF